MQRGLHCYLSLNVENKEKCLYIATYSVKTKSTGHKNVLMLSKMTQISGITKDNDKSKNARMKFYDFRKDETNIFDQLKDYFSCLARTNRSKLMQKNGAKTTV